MNEWHACPECLTLIDASRPRCDYCQASLSWLGRTPEFRAALRYGSATAQTPAWRPMLRLWCLRVDGDGTPLDRDEPITSDVEWLTVGVAAGRPPLRVRPIVAERRLEIEGAPGSISLPGECDCAGWRVRARLVAAARAGLRATAITRLDKAIALGDRRGAVRLGRDSSRAAQDVVLVGDEVAFRHAVAVCVPQEHTDHCWLADHGSETGTFVNGRPIVARRLEPGDLVQIGAYAWAFDRRRGQLTPVAGIDGVEIEFVGAAVRDRLAPFWLRLGPGELIAVIGPTGAGKSTFIKTLIGEPGLLTAGRVLADGADTAIEPEQFRRRLGYVPQASPLERQLSALDAVQFSAAFRGASVDPAERLRLVDLEDARHAAPIHELSGGQEKRVRIATELVSTPGLLVLDEPGSGLDPAHEAEIVRLLARLRDRGCTVVVVTHNLGSLAEFSRVLLWRERRLVFDGPARELRPYAVDGDLARLDLKRVEPNVAPAAPGDRPAKRRRRRAAPSAWFLQSCAQTWQVARRELALLAGRRLLWRYQPEWLRRRFGSEAAASDRRPRWLRAWLGRRFADDGPGLAVPECVLSLVVVPLCFALALDFAVKATDFATLGFLAILSVIWMGASLGLMSIVDQREVFEHERLLFLRVGCYTSAKTLVLYALSVLQTLVLAAALTWLRRDTEPGGVLFGGAWALAYLPLIGCAGAGMGLLISALSRRSKPAANFILPLAMIAQIVFSAQIAVSESLSFDRTYGQFTPRQCRNAAVHPNGRRAEVWIAEPTPKLLPGWYCRDCYEPDGKPRQPPRSEAESRRFAERDEHSDGDRPNLAATYCSYLTISRYADVALRSFAYREQDAQAFHGTAAPPTAGRATPQSRHGYSRWRREASWLLAALAVAFPLAVAGVLGWQTDPRWRAFPRRVLGRLLGSAVVRLRLLRRK